MAGLHLCRAHFRSCVSSKTSLTPTQSLRIPRTPNLEQLRACLAMLEECSAKSACMRSGLGAADSNEIACGAQTAPLALPAPEVLRKLRAQNGRFCCVFSQP
eukprot:2545679-Amphidinium_carterae.1